MTNRDKLSLLAGCDLFAGLDHSITAALAQCAMSFTYQAGDVIFRTGDAGSSMMLVAEGSVRITVLSPTDRDITLALHHAGDVFGEIALLDGHGRSADAIAQTNCTLLVLERAAFLRIAQSSPDLAIKMLSLVCARLRRSDARTMEFAFLALPQRLALTLLDLSAQSQKLSHPQSELANIVGSARENVNRCLRKWYAEGVVDLSDGWIILRDRARLSEIASSGYLAQ